MSVRPSVHMEQLGYHWTHFHELWYLSIFLRILEKIQVSLKSEKNKWHFTYLAQFFLEWQMFQTKVVEVKKHIWCSESLFFPRKLCLCEIMLENTVEGGRPQMIIWRIAYRITKATHTHTHTHTHSEFVILIAFPLWQWLQECVSMLSYTYSTMPVLCVDMPRHDDWESR
jgi:hypothetical protein